MNLGRSGQPRAARAIIIIIVLVTLFWKIGSSVHSEGSAEWCELVKSAPQRDSSLCEELHDTLERDLCYWHLAFNPSGREPVPRVDYQDDFCRHISNPYLQYVCLRLDFRPHMSSFMTLDPCRQEVKPGQFANGCEDYQDGSALFCTYLNAALLAEHDVERAKDICGALQNDRLMGECLFFVATTYADDIKKVSSSAIGNLDCLCRDISKEFWKAECYYLIADELALAHPEEHLLDIALACNKSLEATDKIQSCYDHVARLLPSAALAKEFCSLGGPHHEMDCYNGLMFVLSRENFNSVSEGIEFCESLPRSHREDCLDTVGYEIGLDLPTGGKPGRSNCSDFSGTLLTGCQRGFAYALGSLWRDDINEGLVTCRDALIPEEVCSREMASALVGELSDVSRVLETCAGLSFEMQEMCIRHMTLNLLRRSFYDFDLVLSQCGELPVPFVEVCYDELALLLIELKHSPADAFRGCNSFPQGYKERCLDRVRILESEYI